MILGLTGGSGCGKTEACSVLKEYGAAVINADQVAREIVQPGFPALKELTEEFGPAVLKEDGELNRRKLGDLVFSDPDKRKKLNAITHPHITRRILAYIEESRDHWLIVIDAPVLFESGIDKICDHTAAVIADNPTRLARIMERDGLTQAQAQARIGAQISNEEYAARVDFVNENNEGKETLRNNIIELIKRLKGE